MVDQEEAPLLFRCPISMELMEEPMTVSTGVTYERKNIERWFYTYKKATCPATMQRLESFGLTPNRTLERLIESWRREPQRITPPPPSSTTTTPTYTIEHEKMVSLLADIESADPFKVSSLRKLRSVVETSAEVQNDFVRSGGIHVLARTMSQIVHEGADFAAFRACEESVAVLHRLPVASAAAAELLSEPECMRPMMLVLQRGSAEARLHTMTVLQKLSRTSKDWMVADQEVDVTGSLLELLSDGVSTKLSSCSLDVLIELAAASKKNRRKAIEAGAVCVLVELLPDAGQHTCEKILLLLSRLCDCPEGRSAFADHALGVAVVSKKILRVSELVTKLGVKVLSKVCNFLPTDRVIDGMIAFGAVRKLFCLLHVDGGSSTKDKARRMIRVHGRAWKHYPCFPCELKENLKLVD